MSGDEALELWLQRIQIGCAERVLTEHGTDTRTVLQPVWRIVPSVCPARSESTLIIALRESASRKNGVRRKAAASLLFAWRSMDRRCISQRMLVTNFWMLRNGCAFT